MNAVSNNILTFLLIIYYILTIIFPNTINGTVEEISNRIYPQATMAIIGIYCIYIWITHWSILNKSIIIRPFLYLTLISFFYILLVVPTETLFSNFTNFMKFNMAILVMFAYYIFSLRNPIKTQRNIVIIFAMQLVYVFYTLLYDRFYIQAESELFDSNAGFLMITCIPMTLILPNKRLRLYVYVAVVVGCIFSGQRSAALAAIASFPFCWTHLKQHIKKNDKIILFFLVIIAIYPILKIAITNIMLRNALDASTGSYGSGRSIFWRIVWDDFWTKDILHILFGNGMNSIAPLLKMKFGIAIGAHNGWLDMLYSYGIIGLGLYANIIINLYTSNKKISRLLFDYRNILLIIAIIFTLKSITSHGYWDITVMPIGMTLSFISCQYKLKLYNAYNEKKTWNNK